MNDKPINRVDCVKFLGVFIDDRLNFKQHIKFLISKLNSVRGMVYSRRQFLPDSCRRSLYYALVNSRLLYGIQVYSETKKNVLDPLHI